MKPEDRPANEEHVENPVPVTGDVIGDTAYSERFVLKILLKLANLDSLKDEIKEKSFEEDLCTLWDMTAERDVVLFLQKHDVLNLFNFALPVIDSPRIIEIIIGIIGNMCCQKEVVPALLKKNGFLTVLLEFTTTDDSLILIQVLRLVSSGLFLAEEDDIEVWIKLFENVGYSSALYFILKNSSNKDLLVTALENFNTVTSCCNTEKSRLNFFTLFVTLDALESLSAAFIEVTVNQKDLCDRDILERILVIALQIILNLVGFDKSPEIYVNSKENVINIIEKVLTYYEKKTLKEKELDIDLFDIIDSTNTIINVLKLNETAGYDKYFVQSYSIWKFLKASKQQNGDTACEGESKNEVKQLSKKVQAIITNLLCMYMEKCSESNLLKVLDKIGTHYEDILTSASEDVQAFVSNRSANYRARLKDNVDSQ